LLDPSVSRWFPTGNVTTFLNFDSNAFSPETRGLSLLPIREYWSTLERADHYDSGASDVAAGRF
jgi:hypothetical protein